MSTTLLVAPPLQFSALPTALVCKSLDITVGLSLCPFVTLQFDRKNEATLLHMQRDLQSSLCSHSFKADVMTNTFECGWKAHYTSMTLHSAVYS